MVGILKMVWDVFQLKSETISRRLWPGLALQVPSLSQRWCFRVYLVFLAELDSDNIESIKECSPLERPVVTVKGLGNLDGPLTCPNRREFIGLANMWIGARERVYQESGKGFFQIQNLHAYKCGSREGTHTHFRRLLLKGGSELLNLHFSRTYLLIHSCHGR